ncbi:MAG: thymidine phosphorylase [Ignavibacteria bacterium]|nr:thymidine phosphorylase [Ignavibacteria bacterium]
MNAVEIIKLKRDNKKLSEKQLQYFIEGFIKGKITDYQMSAFLMAIYFNGLDEEETFNITKIFIDSGKKLNLSSIKKPKVDKHSTGGVGDKTSLILAPLVASCGIAVPMISGRGLGHTGGTLDKLSSIPGFNINLTPKEFIKILNKIGCVMAGQTYELCPADKLIYQLRDVTATVDIIPLMTASIMSKKIAEGTNAIVFDIKTGSGANLSDTKKNYKLIKSLLNISKRFKKKAIAVITDMNQPLGYKVGNLLEVEECIELMLGKNIPDLYEITSTLAGCMIFLGKKAKTINEGKEIAKEKIINGTAYKKFIEMVKVQGGDVKFIKNINKQKRAKEKHYYTANKTGYLEKVDALNIGLAGIELGCGRKIITDKIDFHAGIEFNKKEGDFVKKGEIICTLYSSNRSKIDKAIGYIDKAIKLDNNKPRKNQIIKNIIFSSNVS